MDYGRLSSKPKEFRQIRTKKAIDIANAMLKDGYKESDVIPIATQQAEKWYKQASEEELEELKNKHITQHQQDKSAQPELNEKPVHIYFEDNEWKVKQKMQNRHLIHSHIKRCYKACQTHCRQ